MASRRRGRDGKRAGGSASGHEGPEALSSPYEGPEALSAMLARAGSPHDAAEVARRFGEAQDAGAPRSAVIPDLFPAEPRFDAPDAARRLYGNLLALWDLVAAGQEGAGTSAPPAPAAPAAKAPAAPLPAPAPAPERGSVEGRVLPPDFVESAWRWLASLPPREAFRLRDRFQNLQPDLDAWMGEVDLPDAGGIAAHDLVLEAWAILDRAVDRRLGVVDWRELREIHEEPPPLETVQPAFAAYVAEQLDNLEDEEAAFGPTERAQVERVVSAAVAALTGAVAGGR